MSWGGGFGKLPTGRSGKVSLWWVDILKILEEGNGGWFGENLEKVIGDGSRSFFWEENWTGEGVLREMYPRLFNLNLDKRGTVRDFGSWVEDRWEWSWRWRRSLLDRDIIYLNALNNLLDRFHLRNGVEDTWKWRLSVNGLYSTKDTYDLLL
ncbi:hypothetical protein ACS0TY_031577 [Phlomoides rotata]